MAKFDEVRKAAAKAKGLNEADAIKAVLKAPKDTSGLVDMKMPKKTKKEMNATCSPCDPIGGGDRYPYGLELRLDNESMEKLGIDLPAVGKEISITAKAKVEEASSRETQEGGPKLSCTLQITKLKVG